MIVSHRHRYIFVRTRKTAGTSVEIALSKFCGPDDVITRDADDALRRELGYPGPQNDGGMPLSQYTFSEWRRLLTSRRTRAVQEPHTGCAHSCTRWRRDLAQLLQVRDRTRSVGQGDFAVLLAHAERTAAPAVAAVPEGSGRAVVVERAHLSDRRQTGGGSDHQPSSACRRSSRKFVRSLALPEPLALPRAKGTHRAERSHYSQLIGPAERAVIDAACRREIELLGYRFGAPAGVSDSSAP